MTDNQNKKGNTIMNSNYKTVEELLQWANAVKKNSVHDCGWSFEDDDFDDVRIQLCEQENEGGEVVREDIGHMLHTCDARLCAAAPDLYRAAREAYKFLVHSSLTGADKVREHLDSAITKAGGAE